MENKKRTGLNNSFVSGNLVRLLFIVITRHQLVLIIAFNFFMFFHIILKWLYNSVYFRKEKSKMKFKRQKYINEMKKSMWNDMAKIITGPRRVGKSYLLFNLFKDFLLSQGVKDDEIVQFSFDYEFSPDNLKADNVLKNILSKLTDATTRYYVLLDEIQEVDNFVPLMNYLLRIGNVDLYVTGSNSHMLSSDVVTEFAGRGWQIPVRPLSLIEITANNKELESVLDGWNYMKRYGGYPIVANLPDDQSRERYLKDILKEIYLKDLVRRHNLKSDYVLNGVLKVLSSSIGSLTNPDKIARTFRSKAGTKTASQTISNYLNYLEDSFLIEKAERFDLAGKQYIGAASKFFFEDLGIRNAVNDFQGLNEEGHLMENAVYNELVSRGYEVDVGVVPSIETDSNGNRKNVSYEIDFIARGTNEKFYIQVTHSMNSQEQRKREESVFGKIRDSFPKITISKDSQNFFDENGILHIDFLKFLMDESCLRINALKDKEMEM